MRRRTCRKCATGQRHPFRHWHLICPYCFSFRIFRGPSCGRCHREALDIIRDMFEV